jgi:putative transposase
MAREVIALDVRAWASQRAPCRSWWASEAPEIRKVIYTTNAIESVNFSLRKITKTRASFPNDEAAIKLLYLALRNISKRWTMPIQNWKQAMSQLMMRFEAQFDQA